MSYKDILKVATDMESLALVGENVKFAKKKKKKVGDFVGMAGTNIAGSALIKAQAEMIG